MPALLDQTACSYCTSAFGGIGTGTRESMRRLDMVEKATAMVK